MRRHRSARLASAIAAVAILLSGATAAWKWRGAPAVTRDDRAVNAYLAGRAIVLRPVPDDLRNAARYFSEAIALDPNYAEAWAGLASAYKRMPVTATAPAHEAFGKARDAANRALAVDPNNAEAISTLGTIAVWYDWDYQQAEKHLKRALAIQPDHADSHLFLGIVYSVTGRSDEALREIRAARQLDPQWPQARAMEGLFLFMGRRYHEALRHLDAVAKDMDPTLWTTQLFRAETLLFLDRPDDAWAASDEVMKLKGHPGPLGLRGYLLARMNRVAETEAYLAQLAPDEHHRRALILHALGRNDQAMTQLHAAADQRTPHMTGIGVDPKWDTLRRWQPFRDVARRANLLEVSDATADRFVARAK